MHRIEVRWIGARVEVYRGIAADRLVTITEGKSKLESRRLSPEAGSRVR